MVVRGVVDLLALDQDTELSFAMDNGVTLLVSRQDRDGSTYINANRFHEELIFDDKGLPIEG